MTLIDLGWSKCVMYSARGATVGSCQFCLSAGSTVQRSASLALLAALLQSRMIMMMVMMLQSSGRVGGRLLDGRAADW